MEKKHNETSLTKSENHKAKIVHLCLSCFYIDDFSYQENMLPKYHKEMGYDVTVIASLVSFDSNGKPCILPSGGEYMAKDGYKVVRLDYKKPFHKLNSFIRIYDNLMKYIVEEAPDILFIHDYSFMDILPVMEYAKKNNVTVYSDCHTDYINSAKSWVSKNIFHHLIWRLIGKKIKNDIKFFYGVTPLRCDFLKDAYQLPDEKIKFLRMGVDDHKLQELINSNVGVNLRKELRIEDDEFVILTGGKIDFQKNIHLVLEAVRNIKNSNKKFKLVVFGVIAPESKEMIDQLLDSENIIFVGWLSQEKILDYLLMSDLIIFPGTHSVLWEQAVGAGKPAIFKYWDGMTHVDIGGNCRFLRNESIEEIEKVLIEILNDPDVYKNMLEKANSPLAKEFYYSVISKKSIELC
ncbi:glycosyltransferase family 4 protein [Chryseobacterium aurantiacum]|uniref:glycosyltransferase family 4 protein n=1 Tax=Chryseobacterium aurantiacum TaxID=2116499 RepID=UPI000D11E2A5|nr:glycosyltransferase family 4 protein [Chryseobacterium aurantiacum]